MIKTFLLLVTIEKYLLKLKDWNQHLFNMMSLIKRLLHTVSTVFNWSCYLLGKWQLVLRHSSSSVQYWNFHLKTVVMLQSSLGLLLDLLVGSLSNFKWSCWWRSEHIILSLIFYLSFFKTILTGILLSYFCYTTLNKSYISKTILQSNNNYYSSII